MAAVGNVRLSLFVNFIFLSKKSPKANWVIMQSGTDERSIPGNTVAVQADMPFSGLTTFGTAFLSKFQCSQMPHPVSSSSQHDLSNSAHCASHFLQIL